MAENLETLVESLISLEQAEDYQGIAERFPIFKEKIYSWFSVDGLPDLLICRNIFDQCDAISADQIRDITLDLYKIFEGFLTDQDIRDIDHYTADRYFFGLVEHGVDSQENLDAGFEILISACTHENADKFDISHVFSDLDEKSQTFPILRQYFEQVEEQFAPLILKLNDEARRPFLTEEQASELKKYLSS
jgi:hypothetical protein